MSGSILKRAIDIGVPAGKVLLVWFNKYSGTLIRTLSSALLFDPVGLDPRVISNLDAVVITHEHYDHFDEGLLQDLEDKTKTFIVTPYIADQLRMMPREKVKDVEEGDMVKVRGTRITAAPSNHPGMKPLTFIVETDIGINIYHSSDSRPFQDMEKIGREYPLDITLCTVGIAPGTSPESGVQVAKLTHPQVAIPYHTDDEEDLLRFAEILKREEPGIKAKILKPLEIYLYPERE